MRFVALLPFKAGRVDRRVAMRGEPAAALRLALFLVGLIAAFILLAGARGAMAASFSGNFNGIATAAGMTLSLQETGARVVGRLSVPGGRNYALNGERTEKGVQGTLRLGGSAAGVAFFRMEERPLGVQFLFMPARADGRASLDEAREYSFMKQGVAAPPPSRYLAAPGPEEKVGIVRFVDEYRLWSPRDVARIYASLDERSQGLVQLYDHASADILWRVCAASLEGEAVPDEVMHELLDRQQTDCASLMPLAEAARKGGLFHEFERRARFQFEIVRETVLCNRGESTPEKCADVSALGAPMIVHWRDASSIMRELAGLSRRAPGDMPDAERMAAERPPLRATIVDVQEAGTKTLALKDFLAAKRRGVRLPLPNPRG